MDGFKLNKSKKNWSFPYFGAMFKCDVYCRLVILFISSLFMAGCKEEESNGSSGVDSDRLFLDYTVWAEEDRENVTCRFQFKYGDADAEALRIDPPGQVLLDGETLTSDSTRFMGVFYEVQKPVSSFGGRHTITLKGTDGKTFSEQFDFHPFYLSEELPEIVRRGRLVITLDSFPARETALRLVMVDTSLATDDVNEVIRVVNGAVEIEEWMLERLVNGPINLEISKEEERPVRKGTETGGWMSITYVLRRGFDLAD